MDDGFGLKVAFSIDHRPDDLDPFLDLIAQASLGPEVGGRADEDPVVEDHCAAGGEVDLRHLKVSKAVPLAVDDNQAWLVRFEDREGWVVHAKDDVTRRPGAEDLTPAQTKERAEEFFKKMSASNCAG